MAKSYINLSGGSIRKSKVEDADANTSPAPQRPSIDDVRTNVVFILERIADECSDALRKLQGEQAEPQEELDGAIALDSLAAGESPRALFVCNRTSARQAFTALNNAGFHLIIPETGDSRLDASKKLADESVKLAGKPSRALLRNAYAILRAAEDSDAQCIFLGRDARELILDERFLKRAQTSGKRVFALLEPDATYTQWIEFLPEEGSGIEPTHWRTCHACGLTFDDAEFTEGDHACPECGTLARLTPAERVSSMLDEGSFTEWDADVSDVDPLDFAGYPEKLEGIRQKTDADEAILTGVGKIGGMPVAVGFMDTRFLMASMGSVVGEKVSRLFDRATEERLPVVIFCASGGARMQEGLASLMQMAKTSAAVSRHDKAGLLYISVLTDPTTGGVTASFATLGDIILAEPGAMIGFAGQRVIRDTIKQELPPGFQTAEFALEHGLIDAIVKREHMRDALHTLLALHDMEGFEENGEAELVEQLSRKRFEGRVQKLDQPKGWFAGLVDTFTGAVMPDQQADKLTDEERELGAPVSERDGRELERHARKEQKRAGISTTAEPGSAWENVQLARNVHRPTARVYINAMTDIFFELHGDRAFGDDGAIVGGIGIVDGMPVTLIAEEKGSDLNDRIQRNFGCPQPEGYRKSARLMRQAEKFGRAIVCLVDTQGAFCGMEAEERGQGNAIAENLELMASLRVPIVSVILGEGGSGGALALALSNRVAMQEHAVYSVLSPEGFASILWRDGKRAPEAAEVMRMSAEQVLELGVIEEVILEGEGPAHENPDVAIANVCMYVESALEGLSEMSGDELVAHRARRFAKF